MIAFVPFRRSCSAAAAALGHRKEMENESERRQTERKRKREGGKRERESDNNKRAPERLSPRLCSRSAAAPAPAFVCWWWIAVEKKVRHCSEQRQLIANSQAVKRFWPKNHDMAACVCVSGRMTWTGIRERVESESR